MKIISLHLEECKMRRCPNKDSCYHRERRWDESKNVELLSKVVAYASREDVTVHSSICNEESSMIEMVNDLDFFNITVSANLYKSKLQMKHRNSRIQVSAWTMKDICTINEQKLYLVKDQSTFLTAMAVMGQRDIRNIYFPFDQKWVEDNKDKFKALMMMHTKCKTSSVEIDICARFMLLEERCPYEKDYIDITGDGRFRKCPFNDVMSEDIGNKSIEELFNTEPKSNTNCIYKQLLEVKNGR